MLFTRLTRRARSRVRWYSLLLAGVCFLDAIITLISYPSQFRIAPDETRSETNSPSRTEKIFIASIHRNNEKILLSHWNEAVLNLVRYFGNKNVYFSTYESGSLEGTKDALADLEDQLGGLGVRRSVILDPSDQIEEVSRVLTEYEEGWIETSHGTWELRRIPYLARLRNRVMEKLKEEATEGRRYDIVLWINDVVFTTEDITTLLATRDGEWDAVCSLDFMNSSRYYDTFALRDSDGRKAITQTWPFFSSSASRNALLNNDPVPVSSCWNGVTAFKAEPFYATPPLQFRGVSDDLANYHLEGSECCLIHADNRHAGGHGVWLNPNVRVAYNAKAYAATNPISGYWPPPMQKLIGTWNNRLTRWFAWPKWHAEDAVVRKRLRQWISKAWKEQKEVADPGEQCLINESQVLFEAGWRHV